MGTLLTARRAARSNDCRIWSSLTEPRNTTRSPWGTTCTFETARAALASKAARIACPAVIASWAAFGDCCALELPVAERPLLVSDDEPDVPDVPAVDPLVPLPELLPIPLVSDELPEPLEPRLPEPPAPVDPELPEPLVLEPNEPDELEPVPVPLEPNEPDEPELPVLLPLPEPRLPLELEPLPPMLEPDPDDPLEPPEPELLPDPRLPLPNEPLD